MTDKPWTTEHAMALCVQLEYIAAKHGGHVALTGGTLYNSGGRKDVDILIYRSADEPPFDWVGFFAEIQASLRITAGEDYGWCKKAVTEDGWKIDFFDPFAGGEHMSGDTAEAA